MTCIIGIDIGTTNIKAAAYDLSGRRIVLATRRMVTHHPKPDLSEYQPLEVWQRVSSCIREVLSVTGNQGILGVGIASMAESGVPLDAAGSPTYPIIAWFDPRTGPQAEWLVGIIGAERVFSMTGQYPHAKYGINKLLWLRDNEPAAFEATSRWLSMEDYIIYRLSGEFATDYSIASRTMAFDIVKREWSREILGKAGLSEELMPPAHPGGAVVGRVSRKASEETGLKEGVPVVTGGHDHACAAMGVNILEPGTILDSMGTSEATMIAVEEPRLTSEAFAQRLCMYPHYGEPPYRVITSIQAAGGSVEWFLEHFGGELEKRSPAASGDVYELLMEEAAKSPPGASGLFYVPHIRGLVGSAHARGAFVGLRDSHGFGDFARAIVEGLTFELRDRIEGCEKIFNSSFTRMKVVGGASKSAFWMQTKADLLGRVVEVPANDEAASFGAALLASLGAGVFRNAGEAAENLYRVEQVYSPDMGIRGDVDKRYRLYGRVVSSLLDIYRDYDF